MSIAFLHSRGTESPIKIPAIGLELFVRMPPQASAGAICIIETVNAPNAGPPRHRHPEAEVFRVIEGRYLYEIDGRRFFVDEGDIVSIPGGAAHGFVNVTSRPARQLVMIMPAFDASRFFTELGQIMEDGIPTPSRLSAFGERWNVEFLGPPVRATDETSGS
ncbi:MULTISPECIES: cupin domain-containing protein [unclassified Chelatococcus]|uniref:cupin domain-containing protein n=1 Tax=unclassified Chelatococcus TaxID=2638111 RepID=UPI001BCDF502|nr:MULTISPECIES: cupin domain-containing protein [unclassified Chelatococcus]MBS7700799.1 cupin domain-containing protein [Chelatococcus sp. YT9]MBX3559657.1 cupin domain-containing protein [Chelatococcus sp.]